MVDPPGPFADTVALRGQPTLKDAGRHALSARTADFDHLALRELRTYRTELGQEETRLAYCRRVISIQRELTHAGRTAPATDAAFRRALRRGSRADQLGTGRDAILALVPADGLPPLPDLLAVSTSSEAAAGPSTPAVEALTEIEDQLAAYQDSVRLRIQAATAELIARYRERPALAVRALPLTPVMNPRETGY